MFTWREDNMIIKDDDHKYDMLHVIQCIVMCYCVNRLLRYCYIETFSISINPLN